MRPPAATVATSGSLLCQLTSDESMTAPVSLTTHASSANGTPASITGGGGEMNTDCTAPAPTTIVDVTVLPSHVHTSGSEPERCVCTTPSSETVATDSLPDDQVHTRPRSSFP